MKMYDGHNRRASHKWLVDLSKERVEKSRWKKYKMLDMWIRERSPMSGSAKGSI